MGLMVGIVGFLTFLIAAALHRGRAPAQFGVVVAASGVGSLLGSLLAPALRRSGTSEERILQIVLGSPRAGPCWRRAGGIVAARGAALCVGVAASSGKLAFDSVVQRDAPDANRGRSFARFETRSSSHGWSASIPVVLSLPMQVAGDQRRAQGSHCSTSSACVASSARCRCAASRPRP